MLTKESVKEILDEFAREEAKKILSGEESLFMPTNFIRHPYIYAITGEEVDKPCWQCEIYKQLDTNCEYRPVSRRTVTEILRDAESLYPYEQIGYPDTYCQFNEGWTKAIEYIASRLKIEY